MLILNMPKVSDNEVKVCSSNHRLQTALNIKGHILFQHLARCEVREIAVSTSALPSNLLFWRDSQSEEGWQIDVLHHGPVQDK